MSAVVRPDIVHITSVHRRDDARIMLKECQSLASAGHSIALVVADGMGSVGDGEVAVIDVGRSSGRVSRMLLSTAKIFSAVRAMRPQICHIHDPELIPAGLLLQLHGIKIVFDSHEDVPAQLLGKPYLNAPLRALIAAAYRPLERWACGRFDAIVAATPHIAEKFSGINKRTVNINNFPVLDEVAADPVRITNPTPPSICYIGGISADRGIREIIRALEVSRHKVRLELAGRFAEPAVKAEVAQYRGWESVDHLGWLDRSGVQALLRRAAAGLVTLHPAINYIDALPVKMFEYMTAGIPVIGSHFPLWRAIIEGNDCGRCVDPQSAEAIAEAMDFFIENPDEARRMGENGRRAVTEKYNWHVEEKKLLALYNELLRKPPV